MSTRHPSCIYTEQLQTVGEGDAIWLPEPHTSGEVQIGDVGCIIEGAFVRLFNVISPDRYPVPDSDLPEGFEPLQAPRTRFIDTRERALAPGHHNSKSVVCSKIELDVSSSAAPGVNVGTTWEYTCRKEKGAVLILKNFSTKQTANAQSLFERYAIKHHDSWVRYASEMTSVKPVLVRGWVKTTADWTATTFTSSGSKFTASMGGGVPGAGGVKTAITRQNSIHGPVMNRVGIYAHDERPEDAPYDQCIFIRTVQVKRRQRVLNMLMRGGAGPDQLPDQRDANAGRDGPAVQVEDDQGEVDMTDTTTQHVPYGPMDAVLDYILENSDAEVAVCSNEDLEFRLLGLEWPEDVPQWLRMNQPQIEVDNDGVGTLPLIEAINRRRAHLITFGMPSTDPDVPDAPLPPFNAEEARSSGLPQLNALGQGELLLATKPGSFEWPHFMVKDNNTENGANLVMALSPNAKYLVTSCDDTTILLWNVPKARAIRRLETHTDTVWAAVFSPDSTRLVSGSADTTGVVWDVEAGTVLFVLEGHSADVWTVVYSPDATKIATGSTDCTVKIWDAHTGAPLHSLEDHFAHVMHVAFSPDSALVASCADAVGLVWDATTGARVAELEGHQGAIWCMRFSHAGDRLITGSEDHTARVWDARAGAELVTLREHTSPVWAVAFAPDDAAVVSGSYDCTVVACDSFSGEQRHVFVDERNPSPIDTVAYSPCGDFLASGSADGHVRLWDTRSGEFVAEFRGHEEKVKSVVFTPDSSDIISSSEDGTVRGWNVDDVLRLY